MLALIPMGVEPVQIKRAVLTPLAEAKGLGVETEALAPGTSEAAQAYGFLSCGADLLLNLTDREGFPSDDRRTVKRGVKWMLEGVLGGAGQQAAIYLAQAFALGLEWPAKWEGHDESANIQREFRQLIQRQYPLADEDLAHLGELDVLYRIMETTKYPMRSARASV